jgi:hypothetical protein
MDQPTPSVSPALVDAPNTSGAPEVDPLVKQWSDRIVNAKKHWKRFHDRVRHNRKVVRGIDDKAAVTEATYNKDRANLIQSTLTVVLSRIYAKNPEMSAEPTNKAQDLRLFCDTISRVTQVMLETAKLKQKAKATVRAAMTCSRACWPSSRTRRRAAIRNCSRPNCSGPSPRWRPRWKWWPPRAWWSTASGPSG